jgi:hypothetical protein
MFAVLLGCQHTQGMRYLWFEMPANSARPDTCLRLT